MSVLGALLHSPAMVPGHMGAPDCYICTKHQLGDAAQGGVLYEDELVYVGHIHALDGPTAYQGYLMVEPKRHVAMLGDLTDEEAARLGVLANRAAAILRRSDAIEHVYSFVFGDGVPHLHVHIAPRYRDTPRKYWGARLREWPAAPTVNEAEMRRFINRLRRHWTQAANGAPSTGG